MENTAEILYCYPPRVAAEEQKRLIRSEGDDLLEINHFCHAGYLNIDNNFNVLIYDGGTGDSTIYLAEQLKNTEASITYLGYSETALNIARKRAEARELSNINWLISNDLVAQLAELPKFDFISYSDNLSHNENYQVCLKALKNKLKDSGVLKLTINAKYGWRHVEALKPIMQTILSQDNDLITKVKSGYEFIQSLPDTNAFKQQFQLWTHVKQLEIYPDTGLYNLFMHDYDKNFTVNELYELANFLELKVVRFSGSAAYTYNPYFLIQDKELQSFISDMDEEKKHSIAEQYFGRHLFHSVLYSKQGLNEASLNHKQLAPVLTKDFANNQSNISNAINENTPLKINFEGNGLSITIQGNKINKKLFSLLDGENTIENIIEKVHDNLNNVTIEEILTELNNIYQALYPFGYICLKSPNLNVQAH